MSEFIVKVIEAEESVVNLELMDPLTPDINLEVTESDVQTINLEIINTEKLLVSDLPTEIPVTNLTASGVTIGETTVNLGETIDSIAGLSYISGTASPTYLYNFSIDGGSP